MPRRRVGQGGSAGLSSRLWALAPLAACGPPAGVTEIDTFFRWPQPFFPELSRGPSLPTIQAAKRLH